MASYKPLSNEAEFVQAIRHSDENAFRTVYFHYYNFLYRFVWLRTNDAEMSREILQEVFIRLWQNRWHLDSHKSLRAYLYRIAINLLTDHYRRQKRKPLTYIDDPQPGMASMSLDQKFIIFDAIERLPENLYLTFVLSRFEGLSYLEIAQVCRVSVKTVESRMGKALKMLREMLK